MPNSNDFDCAISTQRLTRHFGQVKAVDGIDLNVGRGEIYGFLGPNGAGKTTVIRVLVTLLAPTSGQITVAGFDAVRHPEEVRLRIGAALQDAALDNKQTGRELLRLQGRLYGLSKTHVDERIAELSRLIDIGDAMDRLIGTYSGGMKRRLDLAAALIHRPEILFLDEPTTGLDPISRSRIWEEVRNINQGAWDHHLPDHPVPGRSRCPGRPRRHYRPGQAGRPRDARGPQAGPRLRPDNCQVGRRRGRCCRRSARHIVDSQDRRPRPRINTVRQQRRRRD